MQVVGQASGSIVQMLGDSLRHSFRSPFFLFHVPVREAVLNWNGQTSPVKAGLRL